jgi:hypothetical protein
VRRLPAGFDSRPAGHRPERDTGGKNMEKEPDWEFLQAHGLPSEDELAELLEEQ